MKNKKRVIELDRSPSDSSSEPIIASDDKGTTNYYNNPADNFIKQYSGKALEDDLNSNSVNPKDATFKDICESTEKNNQFKINLFREFLLNHEAIMLLIDPYSGMILEANNSAEKFYGYTAEQLRTMKIDEINMMTANESFAKRMYAYNNERNYFILNHKLSNGSIKTVEVNSSPVKLYNKDLLLSIIHDITDRQNALFSLIESEEKLNAIIESTSDAIWSINCDYKLINANHGALNHFKIIYGEKIKVGENIFTQTMPEESAEIWKRSFARALNGEKFKVELESAFLSEKIITDYLFNPVISVKGKITGVVVSGRDITDTKLAEERLKRSEEKYRALISEASDGIFIADESGCFIEVNSNGCQMLGFDENEIIGKNIRIIVPYNSLRKNLMAFKDLKKGLQVVYESDLLKKDNSLIKAEISAKILNDGRSLYIVRDFTIRYRTDQLYKLRLSLIEYSDKHTVKELLQKTLDEAEIITESKIGFFHFVEEDGKILSLQMWSKNTMENMCTTKPENEHYSIDSAGVWADCARENKVIIHNDFNNVPNKKGMPEGHAKIIRELIVPIKHIGKVVAIIGVGNKDTEYTEYDVNILTHIADLAWDIADKKIAQEKLRESEEKLRKLNDDKDKFFSIIAHDLRSPFTGFLGMSELMSENLSEYTITEISEMSMSLNKSAKSLFKLLTNLLEWSLVQRNLTEFNPEEIDIINIINECLSEEEDVLKNKEIVIEINVPDDLKVKADINMLSTVLRNLITNAVKFSERKGSVNICAELKTDKVVEICVADNGIGMNYELINNLFKIHTNVKRKGTEGELSSGLGLLLCKEFVEKHNGKIWAESEQGKGTKFFFTLNK